LLSYVSLTIAAVYMLSIVIFLHIGIAYGKRLCF